MTEELKIVSKLLEDFNSFLDNRSTIFLAVIPEFFPKLLEWHYLIWKKEYYLLSKKDKIHEWRIYKEISNALDSILKKVEERALKDRYSSLFFDSFEKHVEKYKKEFVHGKENGDLYYIESIIPIFYTTLIENIKYSPEKHDIWDQYFPRGWKITKENMQENCVARVLLDNFLHWARNRLRDLTDKNKFDEVLDNVASNLFPSVEPILWAKLLTLLLRPFANNNRMKSLIEQDINFGFVSRIISSYVGSTEQSLAKLHDHIESQSDATLKLVLFLFKPEFTEAKLNNFISELKALEYDNGSREKAQQEEFISIFEEMISLLKSGQEL